MENLTEGQRSFIFNDTTPNLELTGPAGSGKTLTLELKALREVYEAQEGDREVRIAFCTHSWSSSGQVDSDIRDMDGRGGHGSIEVVPLSALAQILTPEQSWRPSGATLLGDDSLESKELQTLILSELFDTFLESDWVSFRGSCSVQLSDRLDSKELQVREELLEDLLTEFGCVLAAESIFRGHDAKAKYVALPRGAWMMPLESSGDRDVVFHLYQLYLEQLRNNAYVTTDVLMAEFFRYLQGSAWDIEREAKGYDLILVDEVHLFNVQERMALRSLMSDPDLYPRVCVALDMRQSPRIRSQLDSGSGEDTQSIELDVVHRYSPEILALIRHIHDEYPVFDLGEKWRLDIDSIESTAAPGPKPMVHQVEGFHEGVMNATFKRANDLWESGKSTAILVVDERFFRSYSEVAERRPNVAVVAGRDDLLALRGRRKSRVVGLAEHVAGLQFENVLVAGMPDALSSSGPSAVRLRDALTLLYLACSRAELSLELFLDRNSSLPQVLMKAIDAGVVTDVKGL